MASLEIGSTVYGKGGVKMFDIPFKRFDETIDIYVPGLGAFIHFFGAGTENLSEEDFDSGAVDSIYWDMWTDRAKYSDCCDSDDGGLIVLNEYVQSKESMEAWVPRVLEFIYDYHMVPYDDISKVEWKKIDRGEVAIGPRIGVRVFHEDPIEGSWHYASTLHLVCMGGSDPDESKKRELREYILRHELLDLSETLAKVEPRVLRPGVQMMTVVTCEYCAHCTRVQHPDIPNYYICVGCELGCWGDSHRGPRFFCSEGEPRKENET